MDVYNKIGFKDRIDTKPSSYLVDGETKTIEKDNSGIKQEGSNLNAENLNHMDNGIFQNSQNIKTLNDTVIKQGNSIGNLNSQYEDTTKKLNDFGGRNYLLNSNFYLGLKGYTNWCENGNITVKNNICTVRAKNTDTKKCSNLGIVTEKFEVFENETYTISFKVASNGSTNILDYNFILNENQESVRIDNVSVNSNNYSLDKKKITFKAKNTGKIQILIGKVNKGLNLEGFDITEIKLEKGAIATDWTLALEDYIYLVNTQSKRIDAIEQALINKGILEAKKNLSI